MMSEATLRFYAGCLLLALSHLHRQHLIHRVGEARGGQGEGGGVQGSKQQVGRACRAASSKYTDSNSKGRGRGRGMPCNAMIGRAWPADC